MPYVIYDSTHGVYIGGSDHSSFKGADFHRFTLRDQGDYLACETFATKEEAARWIEVLQEDRSLNLKMIDVPEAAESGVADAPMLERVGLGALVSSMPRRFTSREGVVSDVLAIRENGSDLDEEIGFASWSENGRVNFWTHQGAPVDEADVEAHRDIVLAVRQTATGFVSWATDGSIAFWSPSGRLTRQFPRADRRGSHVCASNWGVARWDASGRITFFPLPPEASPVAVDASHEGALTGVVGGRFGFVSWHLYGEARLWSLDGQLLETVSPTPGAGFCGFQPIERGYLAWDGFGCYYVIDFADDGPRVTCHEGLGELFIGGTQASTGPIVWDNCGGIRFLSRTGMAETGGGRPGPDDEILGVLETAEGFVSWGGSGIVRFWSPAGRCLPWGSYHQHWAPVAGAVESAGYVATWDDTGAIAFWGPDFWDEDRNEPENDVECPHLGPVNGVAATPTGFVSWGAEGALLFWSHEGEELEGGDTEAHHGRIDDVAVGKEAVASVGADGMLRFWSHEGEGEAEYTGRENASYPWEVVG